MRPTAEFDWQSFIDRSVGLSDALASGDDTLVGQAFGAVIEDDRFSTGHLENLGVGSRYRISQTAGRMAFSIESGADAPGQIDNSTGAAFDRHCLQACALGNSGRPDTEPAIVVDTASRSPFIPITTKSSWFWDLLDEQGFNTRRPVVPLLVFHER
jgi:hypothetical protein